MNKNDESKRNYQAELEEIIASLSKQQNSKRPTLLLHSCCGPCSSYVLEYLSGYFDITVLYFNPCIFPADEYMHRLEVQKDLIKQMNEVGYAISFVDMPYAYESFLKLIAGTEKASEGGERCTICFKQRLSMLASKASMDNFDYCCSTLTVSPYKNAEVINEIGESLTSKWLPSDFKKKGGYKRSIELSEKYSLYRQDYCGCEFSMR